LAIQALFGERADFVLSSTRLAPQATQASDFRFRLEGIPTGIPMDWHTRVESWKAPLRFGA